MSQTTPPRKATIKPTVTTPATTTSSIYICFTPQASIAEEYPHINCGLLIRIKCAVCLSNGQRINHDLRGCFFFFFFAALADLPGGLPGIGKACSNAQRMASRRASCTRCSRSRRRCWKSIMGLSVSSAKELIRRRCLRMPRLAPPQTWMSTSKPLLGRSAKSSRPAAAGGWRRARLRRRSG